MEVSLDHFSGHCLWSGRDQSFQNVTSKNDPVWNAANPFRFLSTVSTQGIRFFKSKVQNSIAEGFIAPAPGSPHPPPAPHGISKRPSWVPNAGPTLGHGLSMSERVINPGRSLGANLGLLCRRATGYPGQPRQGRSVPEAGRIHGVAGSLQPSSPRGPRLCLERSRGFALLPRRTAPSRSRSSCPAAGFKSSCGSAGFVLHVC